MCFPIGRKSRWRREWDSNPRCVAARRFSRPLRYDRFGISPQETCDDDNPIISKPDCQGGCRAFSDFFIKNHEKGIDNLFSMCYYFRAFHPGDRTKLAGVAQLVEQLICNQQVGGSSPSTSSTFFKIKYGRVPEWPKGTDCKSAAFASVVRIHPLPPK